MSWPCGVTPSKVTCTLRCSSLDSTYCWASSPNGSAGCSLPSPVTLFAAGARIPATATTVCRWSFGESSKRRASLSPFRTLSTIACSGWSFCSWTRVFASVISYVVSVNPLLAPAHRPFPSDRAWSCRARSLSRKATVSSESSDRLPASSRTRVQPSWTEISGKEASKAGSLMDPYSRLAPVGME